MPTLPAVPCLSQGSSAPLVHRGHTVAASATATKAAIAATVLTLSPVVLAQSSSPAPAFGFSGRIGLTVVSTPTYEGSPNTRTLVSPDLTLSYRSRDWGSVDFGQRGLFWNAVEAGPFRLALVAQFDPGRKERKPSALNPTPGDQRLAGMGTVQSSTEAGVGVGYGPVMLVARKALSERGAQGAQADLTVEMPWSLSDRFSLRAAFVATWADRDTMQTYFGVTPSQAQATSFAVYTPKSGLRKVEVSVGGAYALAPRWKLQANLAISRLGNAPAKSPLVGRRGTDGVSDPERRFGGFVALGVAYEF